jgi:hypothetical protein
MIKECPLSGEMMRVHPTLQITRIPGTTQQITREGKEWRCPECDYFEEVDDQDLIETR